MIEVLTNISASSLHAITNLSPWLIGAILILSAATGRRA